MLNVEVPFIPPGKKAPTPEEFLYASHGWALGGAAVLRPYGNFVPRHGFRELGEKSSCQ
jgi:hypothetical protein